MASGAPSWSQVVVGASPTSQLTSSYDFTHAAFVIGQCMDLLTLHRRCLVAEFGTHVREGITWVPRWQAMLLTHRWHSARKEPVTSASSGDDAACKVTASMMHVSITLMEAFDTSLCHAAGGSTTTAANTNTAVTFAADDGNSSSVGSRRHAHGSVELQEAVSGTIASAQQLHIFGHATGAASRVILAVHEALRRVATSLLPAQSMMVQWLEHVGKGLTAPTPLEMRCMLEQWLPLLESGSLVLLRTALGQEMEGLEPHLLSPTGRIWARFFGEVGFRVSMELRLIAMLSSVAEGCVQHANLRGMRAVGLMRRMYLILTEYGRSVMDWDRSAVGGESVFSPQALQGMNSVEALHATFPRDSAPLMHRVFHHYLELWARVSLQFQTCLLDGSTTAHLLIGAAATSPTTAASPPPTPEPDEPPASLRRPPAAAAAAETSTTRNSSAAKPGIAKKLLSLVPFRRRDPTSDESGSSRTTSAAKAPSAVGRARDEVTVAFPAAPHLFQTLESRGSITLARGLRQLFSVRMYRQPSPVKHVTWLVLSNNRNRAGWRFWDKNTLRLAGVSDDPSQRSSMMSWTLCCAISTEGVEASSASHPPLVSAFKSIVFTIAGSDAASVDMETQSNSFITVRRVDGFDDGNIYMCAILDMAPKDVSPPVMPCAPTVPAPPSPSPNPTSTAGHQVAQPNPSHAAIDARPEFDLTRRALQAIAVSWPVHV